MNLEVEIKGVVAKLAAGGDPVEVLTAFASVVSTDPSRAKVIVHTCKSCGEKGSICFQCKAGELLGEQAMLAVPLLLPRLAGMVKGWAAERKAKKQASEGAGPFEPGKQTF